MNGQYFGEHSNTSDIVERTDQDTNSPVVNSDPFADRVPVDPSSIHETAMGGTIAAVGPMNRTVDDEIPMFETPNQEIPMGGTIAAVGPMNETIVHEVPMGEAVSYETPVSETTVIESEVSKSVPYTSPTMGETTTHEAPISTNAVLSAALLNSEETEHFRIRWNEIQGKFVDEPRAAVQQADTLVAEVIEHITQMFTQERSSLEGQWKQGKDISTEDLRKALQHYRSFFNRLMV